MLVNNTNKETTEHVKFIEYTGEYPNLCSGVLTLEIDGVQYKFGHDYRYWHYHDDVRHCVQEDEDPNNPNFEKFWSSGGNVTGGAPDWNFCVHHGEWEIDVQALPEQFRKYASEIDTVFNSNVRQGCCGGCI